MADETGPENGAQDKSELALDLSFVPTWARRPPDNPYAGREDTGDRSRSGRRDERGRPFGQRDGHERRGPRPGGGRDSGGGFQRREGGGRFAGEARRSGPSSFRASAADRRGPRREGERPRPGRDHRPPREVRERLDVRVSFLPDRARLALVVRDIQVSRRAFPLVEIASRFLGREDLYAVKLELPPPVAGAERQTFVQCLECRRVFRRRANAEAHILNDHLDKFFLIEENEVEPPTGSFACVARCRLSGTLLGPPNHHGYNEKIQELWATRYAHMSKGEYLGHIETLRDEALVEQWKDSLRKVTVYRLKEPPEGTEAAPMTRTEAQNWMRAGRVNPLLRESARCLVPGPQSRRMDDPALLSAVSLAWQKESRFPLTLLLALRPAFRHMHLHLFKVNAKETYVTAVPPVPVDLATAPAVVQEIVGFLEAHPGQTRHQVLDGLRPGADPESPAAAELLLHLGNLIGTGGVIEFFNATLVLPRSGARTGDSNGKSDEIAAPPATPAAETPPESGPVEAEGPAAATDPVPLAPEAGAPLSATGNPE